jgi:hypothetical protein
MLPNTLDDEVLNPVYNATAQTSPGYAIDKVNKEDRKIGKKPEIRVVDKNIEEERKSPSNNGSQKRVSKVLPSPPISESGKKFANSLQMIFEWSASVLLKIMKPSFN